MYNSNIRAELIYIESLDEIPDVALGIQNRVRSNSPFLLWPGLRASLVVNGYHMLLITIVASTGPALIARVLRP